MSSSHPLSVLEAYKVYANAYRTAYREFNANEPLDGQILERYQAVKRHKYNAFAANLIGKCHGIIDS